MTIQYINTGTSPNAGNGDSLRVAFSKINANFSSLAGSSSVDFPSQTGHAGQFLTTDGGVLSWAAVSGAGGLSTATVIVSNVAPRNPVLGELWYDDVSGRLYVWYDTFWVDASPRGNANVSTLANGTYTFALTTSGSVVLNGSAFTGGGGVSTGNFTFNGNTLYATPANTLIGTAFNTNPPGHTVTFQHNGGVGGGSGGELKFDYGTAQIKVIKDVGLTQTWTFDSDGNLTIPVTGDITRDGVSAFAIGDSDGGVADNSAGITITTYTLSTSQYDTSGSVTYNIASAGASAAGIIIKGLTVDHTQVISGSFDQGSNTLSWNDYTISGYLWNQVASVTAFVTDSRGYTFYALVTDAWEVPHGPCLVEGTLITMADGTHRAIEDIVHGELIRVWNFDLGEFGEAQPIWIKAAEETDMHNFYTFSDGTELRTVGHHVFNKEAGAFTKFIEDTTPVGTTTFNEHGQEVTLVSKERVVAPTRYYNVWTQYHLNLFANGILTSNRFNNIYPIVDMKFVKDDRVLRSVDEFKGIDEKYINGLRLREQPEEYTAEYIADYVHNRLERLDIANQVEQGI